VHLINLLLVKQKIIHSDKSKLLLYNY